VSFTQAFRSANFSSAAGMLAALHRCGGALTCLQALPASPDLEEGITAAAFFSHRIHQDFYEGRLMHLLLQLHETQGVDSYHLTETLKNNR